MTGNVAPRTSTIVVLEGGVTSLVHPTDPLKLRRDQCVDLTGHGLQQFDQLRGIPIADHIGFAKSDLSLPTQSRKEGVGVDNLQRRTR